MTSPGVAIQLRARGLWEIPVLMLGLGYVGGLPREAYGYRTAGDRRR